MPSYDSLFFANMLTNQMSLILEFATQMTVTWTSGYGIDEAEAFVQWGRNSGEQKQSCAVTLTFDRNSMCGELASPLLNLYSTNLFFES